MWRTSGKAATPTPYLANPAGKIALIDRGACNVSEKVRRASDAGAIGDHHRPDRTG